MIKVKKVWKSYGAITVLRGLSLHIPANKISIILGKSGVGKSVLLRLLSMLETPDLGEIEIDGICYSSAAGSERSCPPEGMIGMLFQSSALFDSMNIADNVGFTLKNLKGFSQDKESIQEAVDKALDQVGLSGFQEKFPSELSGGQKRRAALARLIVYRPKIVLFDEPTTGLDPITARQIAALIQKTQQELSSTAVIVTHDIVSALEIGEYFALHSEGTIVASGPKEEFFHTQNQLLHEFMGSARLKMGH